MEEVVNILFVDTNLGWVYIGMFTIQVLAQAVFYYLSRKW